MNRNSELIKLSTYALLVVIIFAVPLVISSQYILNLLIMMGIYIILSSSMRLILLTGRWFMAHVAIFAIGAFATILSMQLWDLNYWLVLPMAGVIASLVGLAIGYATARVKGFVFVLVTVAMVEVVRLSIVNFVGRRPFKCPTPDVLFWLDFSSKDHFYYLTAAMVAISLYVLYRIEKSWLGEVMAAINESETLSESIGINTVRYRVMIMAAACFFAGIAGAVFAPYIIVVDHSSFTIWAGVLVLTYIVVGGQSTFLGPIIGVVFLTILPELLPGRASTQYLLYAFVILVTLFFLPGGIASLPRYVMDKIK